MSSINGHFGLLLLSIGGGGGGGETPPDGGFVPSGSTPGSAALIDFPLRIQVPTSTDTNWYKFTLPSSSPVYAATAVAGTDVAGDTYLALFDATGDFIADNDDANGGTVDGDYTYNSYIEDAGTLAAGTYYIFVGYYPGTANDGFTVTGGSQTGVPIYLEVSDSPPTIVYGQNDSGGTGFSPGDLPGISQWIETDNWDSGSVGSYLGSMGASGGVANGLTTPGGDAVTYGYTIQERAFVSTGTHSYLQGGSGRVMNFTSPVTINMNRGWIFGAVALQRASTLFGNASDTQQYAGQFTAGTGGTKMAVRIGSTEISITDDTTFLTNPDKMVVFGIRGNGDGTVNMYLDNSMNTQSFTGSLTLTGHRVGTSTTDANNFTSRVYEYFMGDDGATLINDTAVDTIMNYLSNKWLTNPPA